ncbi:tetratricopeptide repeat protein [bacterium]|nr:tetratricopeptide repeat protein [bacterium]
MESVDKRALIQRAQTYYQQGRLDLATNEFLKIVSIDPYDIVALNTLGDIYSRQSDGQQAFTMYQRVAKIYIEKGEYTKAIGVYKKITHIDDKNAVAFYELGKLYENEGMVNEALACYMKALDNLPATQDEIITNIYSRMAQLDPENIDLHLNLVTNFVSQGKNTEAKDELLAVIKGYLAKDEIKKAEEQVKMLTELAGEEDVLFAKGLIAQKSEEFSGAEMLFKKVIGINKYFVDAYYQLGVTRVLAGRDQQAMVPFQQCLKYKPDFIPVLEILGSNYEKQGKAEMAVEKYESAVKSALDKSLFNEAKKLLTKIIMLDPNNIPALERLKSLGEEVPDAPAAPISAQIESEVREAAMVDDTKSVAALNMDIPAVSIDFTTKRKLADLLDEANKFQVGGLDDKAEENFRKVLAIDPNSETALNALAESLMMMGNNNDAVGFYKSLIKVFYNRGEFEDALKIYTRALQLAPADKELPLFKDEIEKRKSVIAQMESGDFDNIDVSEPDEPVPSMDEMPVEAPPAEPVAAAPEQTTESAPAPEQAAASQTVNAEEMKGDDEEDFVDNFADKVGEVIGDDLQGHYDMGIAFYQMQLFSKAIYEFQVASKEPDLFLPACEQISQCFLDQGLPEATLKWIDKAFVISNIEETAMLSLKFIQATAYEMLGDKNQAFKIFLEIYQDNAKFHNVGKIIKRMKKELNLGTQSTMAAEMKGTDNIMQSLNNVTGDAEKGKVAPDTQPPPAQPASQPAPAEKKEEGNDPPPANPKISFL